jgi:hypothetical protein
MDDDLQLFEEFVSSPRNPYGSHASFGYPGGRDAWKKAWRIHFSRVGGGSTSAAASGPLRGTVRRIAMIAAAMKPECNVVDAEKIDARTGPKSPLSGEFKHTPKDYGLSRWKKPKEDDVDADKALHMTCEDLNDIKRICVAEIKRRIADREKAKAKKESRMKRKIGRGNPLIETIKGSLDYILYRMDEDFRLQFQRDGDPPWPYVVEHFADYVTARDSGLAADEYYMVRYEKQGKKYIYVPRDQWEIVELTYQPQTVEERRGSNESQRFVERVENVVRLEESTEGQPRYISGVGLTADVVNANARRYPTPVVVEALSELQGHLHESAGQGRLIVVGEAEHPSDKNQRSQFLETIVNWNDGHVRFNESTRQVELRGRILETQKGQDAIAIMEGGVLPAISMRGYGQSKFVKEHGHTVEEVTKLTITGFDLVAPGENSDPNAGVTVLETRREKDKMDPQELLEMLQDAGFFETLTEKLRTELQEAAKADDKARKEKALREALEIGEKDDLVEAVLAKLAERPLESKKLDQMVRQMLGIGDTDDLQEAIQARNQRLKELEEAEVKRQVTEYIEKEVGSLKYPDWLKKQMVEAVKAKDPKSIEEAKNEIVGRRKEYDAIMAQIELAAMGHRDGLAVLGPVLERDRGVPQFAVVAYELTEALVRSGIAQERDFRKPQTVNERFTARILERFDQLNKHHLIQEAKLFEEAEQTTDLNLPYSVSRTIIAEAFPRLVAVSVFDVDTMDTSPTYIFFEEFAGETGYAASVTDEAVTADHDAWVALANKRITPGTVVVTNSGATVTYTEGTDYVVDYANGKLMALSTGTITDAQALLVDYDYTAIRKGEMAPIERGKGKLSRKSIEAAADRLATEISREAIVFSRSQIGWDATTRTIAMLIKQVQRRIDQGIFYLGLAAALQVANNSGGTWTVATDPVEKLVEYLGVAKVKVANRFYEPTAVVLSLTNSDRLANWEGFSAAGARPDADLRAEGYVGRVKGLPAFESTEFPDDYGLVANRELVFHRVYQPMQLRGPFPSYDVAGGTSKLVAADQYYVEEFNATEAPVNEKGALVKIV